MATTRNQRRKAKAERDYAKLCKLVKAQHFAMALERKAEIAAIVHRNMSEKRTRNYHVGTNVSQWTNAAAYMGPAMQDTFQAQRPKGVAVARGLKGYHKVSVK